MGCLFGAVDYGHSFAGRKMGHILSALAAESGAGGGDATGVAGRMPFALAHTGVIRNDADLRWRIRYPRTDIETDSYIAAQLIE